MILSKEDYLFYLKCDKHALGKSKQKKTRIFGDEIWKYQILMRKYEYYTNVKKKSIAKKVSSL